MAPCIAIARAVGFAILRRARFLDLWPGWPNPAKGANMDRDALKQRLVKVLESETWQTYAQLADDVQLRRGLELDSIDLNSISMAVEAEFRVEIEISALARDVTVGDLVELLQGKIEHASQKAA